MSRMIFIISSREGLKYADELKKIIDAKIDPSYDISCQLWNSDEVYRSGFSTYESLELLVNKAFSNGDPNQMGYAIAVFTPDDELISRDEFWRIPRDNVIFEFGIFMGKLGRMRVFALVPSNISRFHVLSDLHGITNSHYKYKKTNLKKEIAALVNNSADSIIKWIDDLEHPKNAKKETTYTNSNPKIGDIPGFQTSY